MMIDYREDARWTVYIHIVPKEISGYDHDKYYVGITSQKPKRRWRDGKGYKNNMHFSRAILKYGWSNLQHEIIAEHLTKKEACEIEIKLIDKLRSNDYHYGYNISSGGESANGIIPWNKDGHLSDETKKKISDKLKGRVYDDEWKKKIGDGVKKHWQNDENYRKRMSGKNSPNYGTTGYFKDKKGFDNPTSKAVICLNNVKIYGSASEASREYSDFSSICACCRGEQNYAGIDKNDVPLIWMWYDSYKNLMQEDIIRYFIDKLSKSNNKPIVNLDDKKCYGNIKKALSYYTNSQDASYFVKKIKNNQNAYGFRWQYLSEYLNENKISYIEASNSLFFVV